RPVITHRGTSSADRQQRRLYHTSPTTVSCTELRAASRRRSPPTPSTSKSAVPESRRLLPPVLATRRPAPPRSPPTGPPRPQRRPSLPRPPASRARPAASTTAAAWACSFFREDDPHEALYGRRGVAVERDGDALKLARAQHERLGRVVAGDAI